MFLAQHIIQHSLLLIDPPCRILVLFSDILIQKLKSKQGASFPIIMFSSQSADISLNAPCRALAAVQADKVETRFLVGSCALNDSNHIHVIRFHSEVNELGYDAKIEHDKGPVHVLCASPTDPCLVLTAAEQSSSATLYRIPRSIMTSSEGLQYDPEEDDVLDVVSSSTMKELTTLDSGNGGGSHIVDIVWRDSSEDMSSSSAAGEVLTMNMKGDLTQWDIQGGTAQAVRSVPSSQPNHFTAGLLPRVAWDPHGNGETVAVTNETRVGILDWRVDTSIPSGMVDSFSCHRFGVTDIDYNPNKPYILASAGQDSLLKFWDLRFANRPLLVARGGHSHWACKVQYNPFHDQLVLSSGTDSIANLWRLSTISSAPLMTLNDNESEMSETSSPNVRVARHEHGDSIYQVGWSAADAWIYLVVGYDGKAILNHVPSKEKYKILL